MLQQNDKMIKSTWHSISETDLLKQLNSSINGLSGEEAALRLQKYGPNAISEKNRISSFKILLRQFTSLMVIILVAAAAASALLNEWTDSAVILAIVIMNGIIGFFQEYKAEQSIQALKKMAAPQTKVWRNGQLIISIAQEIVPGDILSIEAGDYIPADVRLLKTAAFNTIESALTGESASTEKKSGLQLSSDIGLADQINMAFMGTSCVHGTASAIVCATGMNTELGKIAHLLDTAETNTETPLQKSLADVSKRLIVICFAIVICIFLIGFLRNFNIVELFLTSVSLAVAAIPEGLPAVVTIALAVGVQRMVKRQALMRTLPTVETLGAATVICTDKTGTLTVGEMTVRELMEGSQYYAVTGEGYEPNGTISSAQSETNTNNAPALLLEILTACNNAKLVKKENEWSIVGDPTEAALLTVAAKNQLWLEKLEQDYPKLAEIPFDSDRKRMSILRQHGSNQRLFVKGAVDILIKQCLFIYSNGSVRPITDQDRQFILNAVDDMTSRALRVLGAAYRDLGASNNINISPELESELVWVGLVGMVDPPRSEAKEAIQQCHSAGIRVVMITGDHPNTARAIATELGILNINHGVMAGHELDQLSDMELQNKINTISAFARVTAEHKMRIVNAWQTQKHVVAMTGDGVNDAPAIKAADIGIAMGKSGTEVTKQAADMIITDDNFASIVAAIEEGRGVYANIQKTLQYLLSGNLGELLFVAIAVLIGFPMPLLPVHLLWINLVTDGLPALALATDPVDAGLMKNKPRNSQETMLNKIFFIRMLITAALTASTSLAVFIYSIQNFSIDESRTLAFATLVCAELFRAFGVRHEKGALNILGNSRLMLVVAIGLIIQPWWWPFPLFHSLLNCVQLSPSHILLCLTAGLVPLLVIKILSQFKFWHAADAVN